KIGPNYYHASNFDELADSPILSGKLTEASLKIKQTEISVFAYSPNDRVTALQLLEQTKASIKSVIDYIGFNATDHYTFLFNFLENTDLETVKFRNFGALEHSYSSLYVFPEAQVLAEIDRVSAIMRHEFFHILTPLNLHSQLIESFDFSDPKPSRHIWLYEGVTEWAALSSNVTDSSSFIVYINQLNQKINAYQAAKSSASLVDLALRTYDNEGSEFQTFYQKGAVVAALLDILIIKLSDGNKNLRSVLIELSKKYGPNRGFSEDDFFAEFVSHSYPELSDFIDQYIDGNEDLPIDQLFSTIGVSYALGDVDPNPKTIGLKLRRKDEEPFHISGFSVDYQGDLRPGDVLSRFDNVPVTGPSDLFPAIDEAYKKYAIGDSYPLTVIRGGKPVELTIKMFKRLKSNLLIIDKTPSREQLRYRQLLYFNSKN
ncbi:MAG: hypothetical protein KDD94_09870, partial [Calditrichaeota bacterium]|nr:hypothetical protein [Calditrichota bacterium]